MNVKRSEGDTRGDRFKKRNEGIRGRVALHFLFSVELTFLVTANYRVPVGRELRCFNAYSNLNVSSELGAVHFRVAKVWDFMPNWNPLKIPCGFHTNK